MQKSVNIKFGEVDPAAPSSEAKKNGRPDHSLGQSLPPRRHNQRHINSGNVAPSTTKPSPTSAGVSESSAPVYSSSAAPISADPSIPAKVPGSKNKKKKKRSATLQPSTQYAFGSIVPSQNLPANASSPTALPPSAAPSDLPTQAVESDFPINNISHLPDQLKHSSLPTENPPVPAAAADSTSSNAPVHDNRGPPIRYHGPHFINQHHHPQHYNHNHHQHGGHHFQRQHHSNPQNALFSGAPQGPATNMNHQQNPRRGGSRHNSLTGSNSAAHHHVSSTISQREPRIYDQTAHVYSGSSRRPPPHFSHPENIFPVAPAGIHYNVLPQSSLQQPLSNQFSHAPSKLYYPDAMAATQQPGHYPVPIPPPPGAVMTDLNAPVSDVPEPIGSQFIPEGFIPNASFYRQPVAVNGNMGHLMHVADPRSAIPAVPAIPIQPVPFAQASKIVIRRDLSGEGVDLDVIAGIAQSSSNNVAKPTVDIKSTSNDTTSVLPVSGPANHASKILITRKPSNTAEKSDVDKISVPFISIEKPQIITSATSDGGNEALDDSTSNAKILDSVDHSQNKILISPVEKLTDKHSYSDSVNVPDSTPITINISANEKAIAPSKVNASQPKPERSPAAVAVCKTEIHISPAEEIASIGKVPDAVRERSPQRTKSPARVKSPTVQSSCALEIPSVESQTIDTALSVAASGPIRYTIDDLKKFLGKNYPIPSTANISVISIGNRQSAEHKRSGGGSGSGGSKGDGSRLSTSRSLTGNAGQSSLTSFSYQNYAQKNTTSPAGGASLRELGGFSGRAKNAQPGVLGRHSGRPGSAGRGDDRRGTGGRPGASGTGSGQRANSALSFLRPVVDDSNPEQVYLRNVQLETISTLNKISAVNFEKVSEYFVQSFEYSSAMPQIAQQIVRKSFDEPKFAHLYAQLTNKIVSLGKTPQGGVATQEANRNYRAQIRSVFVRACEEHFKNRQKWSEKDVGEMTEEDFEEQLKIKGKSLGNMRYVGHLFNYNIMSVAAIGLIVTSLLQQSEEQRKEENIECIAMLLNIAGCRLDDELAQPTAMQRHIEFIAVVYANLQKLARDNNLSPRLRFILLDLLALRSNGWRKPTGNAIRKQMLEEKRLAERGLAGLVDTQDSSSSGAKWQTTKQAIRSQAGSGSGRGGARNMVRQSPQVMQGQNRMESNSFSLLMENEELQNAPAVPIHGQKAFEDDESSRENYLATQENDYGIQSNMHIQDSSQKADVMTTDLEEIKEQIRDAFNEARKNMSYALLRDALFKSFTQYTNDTLEIMLQIIEGLAELNSSQGVAIGELFVDLLSGDSPALRIASLLEAAANEEFRDFVENIKCDCPTLPQCAEKIICEIANAGLLDSDGKSILEVAFCLRAGSM